MPLRIVIDARRIQDFGIGTYIRNLIRSLSKLDFTNHYYLITSDAEYAEFAGLPNNFEVSRYRPSRTLGGHIGFALFLRRMQADLYHIPLNRVPFGMPSPYLVTVHDLGELLFDHARGLRHDYRLFQFRRGLLNAARVIAVSQATRKDIESLIGVPAGRIRTIYNAPDPVFVERESSVIPCVTEHGYHYAPDIQRILDRYNIHYPFILYAGRTNPQKNIPRLVEAFAVIRGELSEHPFYRELRLIIIGDEISRYPQLRHAVIQSRVEQAVRFLGFVPLDTLQVFYQAAAAFAFPSLYEGFGLPPLEAMACGTPVISSNVSALAEVIGDAACIVNPDNVFDIARGIREVLLNPERRTELLRRGFEQVKRFSWESAASQVLATYQEIGSRPGA